MVQTTDRRDREFVVENDGVRVEDTPSNASMLPGGALSKRTLVCVKALVLLICALPGLRTLTEMWNLWEAEHEGNCVRTFNPDDVCRKGEIDEDLVRLHAEGVCDIDEMKADLLDPNLPDLRSWDSLCEGEEGT